MTYYFFFNYNYLFYFWKFWQPTRLWLHLSNKFPFHCYDLHRKGNSSTTFEWWTWFITYIAQMRIDFHYNLTLYICFIHIRNKWHHVPSFHWVCDSYTLDAHLQLYYTWFCAECSFVIFIFTFRFHSYYLVSLISFHIWVSEWLLPSATSSLCQQYHDENKFGLWWW